MKIGNWSRLPWCSEKEWVLIVQQATVDQACGACSLEVGSQIARSSGFPKSRNLAAGHHVLFALTTELRRPNSHTVSNENLLWNEDDCLALFTGDALSRGL